MMPAEDNNFYVSRGGDSVRDAACGDVVGSVFGVAIFWGIHCFNIT